MSELNWFPKLGINTAELIAAIEADLIIARQLMKAREEDFGAVNWGDLGVVDIEYRMSILHPEDGPHAFVLIEEASPDSSLAKWLNDRLDPVRFPSVHVECEW